MNNQFDLRNIFSKCFIFQSFDDTDFEVVAQSVQWREFDIGEYFFHEGDAYDGFFLICCGNVDILKETSHQGDIEIFSSLGSGEIFGEIALFLANGIRSASARGVAKGTCCFFPRNNFEQLLQEESIVAHKIVLAMARTLSERLDRLTKKSLQFTDNQCQTPGNGNNRDLIKFKDQLASLWSF